MARYLPDRERYIEAATRAIRGDRTWGELYRALHGADPQGLQAQLLNNRLNPSRSNPSADMLGFCVERLPELHHMTLGEFFGITDVLAPDWQEDAALSSRSPLVAEARMFALGAHGAVAHKRKYTGEPYSRHLAEVADLVARHTDNCPTLVAAAWLHDVIEDTAVSASEIEHLFGEQVARIVAGVTDVSTPADGDRASRKALDRQHIALQSAECKTIKLADMISNAATIVERAPAFARVYLIEKRQLLEVLREGNADLFALAERTVTAGLRTLGVD